MRICGADVAEGFTGVVILPLLLLLLDVLAAAAGEGGQMATICALAWRCWRRVMRARTTDSTSGMRVLALVEVVGRETERMGRRSGFAGLGGAPLVGLEGMVVVTGPLIEAWIREAWMCVPGPGMYLEVGPRRVPGKATLGRSMLYMWLVRAEVSCHVVDAQVVAKVGITSKFRAWRDGGNAKACDQSRTRMRKAYAFSNS